MCHILLKEDVSKNLNNFSERMKISAAQFGFPELRDCLSWSSALPVGFQSMFPISCHTLPSCILRQKLGCHLALLYLPPNQSKAAGSQIPLDPSTLVQAHTVSCLVYCNASVSSHHPPSHCCSKKLSRRERTIRPFSDFKLLSIASKATTLFPQSLASLHSLATPDCQ